AARAGPPADRIRERIRSGGSGARMGRPPPRGATRADRRGGQAQAGDGRHLPGLRRRRRPPRRSHPALTFAALDAARRAEIREHALLAARGAGEADAAAVPDEEVREDAPLLARHEPDEVLLDL